MREIERITRIVIEAYKRVRKKRALWKINWAILSRVLKFTRGRRKEIPSVYTVNKYHFFVRVDGKLYEFLIVYDKVFVYKYKEVDRFATVIR